MDPHREQRGEGRADVTTSTDPLTGDALAEERYRLLMNALDEAFCVIEMIVDDAGRAIDYLVLEANPAFARHAGAEDAVGRRIRAMRPSYSQEWIDRYDEVARTGEPARFQKYCPGFDRVLNVHAFRVGAPPDRRVGVLFTDVTWRLKAETALRESEERYRVLVESAKEYAMVMMDAQGRITSWNTGAQRIFQHREDEILNQPSEILFTEEDRAAGVPQQELATAAREGSASDDRWQRRQDGSRFWANGVTTAVYNESGELRGFTKVLRDNTRQKEHQEQIQRIMEELNHRVKNTLAVVQSVAQQTARKASDLGAFIRDFENRLQSIAKAHSLLTRANWRGADLRAIVESELGASAPTKEQLSISGPPVQLSPKTALAIHMVIHELTTNALKYGGLRTADGGLEIAWSVNAQDELELTWVERSSTAIQPPRDAGYGSALLRQIVEYELSGTWSQEFPPTGMRCRIRVALSGAETSREASAPALAVAGPLRASVLVVEDSGPLAMQLMDTLTASGFTVVGPVARLEQALRLAQQEDLCAAMLDVDLNGVATFPVARSLRERGVPFAFLTGHDVTALPPDLRDVTILSKPLREEALQEFLQRHC